LYGWAQKMYLPISDYKWLTQNQFSRLDFQNMTLDQKKGYVCEVDLEFPASCHTHLQDLPLAPFHKDIKFETLSPYSQKIQENIYGRERAQGYKQRKLVTDFTSKKRYVVHYLNLQLYLRLGAKISQIHNVIEFTQSNFLKPYIEYLSGKRATCTTKFRQNLWKLLSNSLYGKFIQDVRKYSKICFTTCEKTLGRYMANPFFEDCTKLSDKITMIFMKNDEIKLDRLYSIGFSILELSKFFMYSAWYDFIKPCFQNKVSLVLSDTDSFVIKCENDSKQSALEKLKGIMDYSNFPSSASFYNKDKKKVPGYFKDEYPLGLITEAVSVRSKCYFLKVDPDPNFPNSNFLPKSHIVCKGISQNVSSLFPIDLYKECIFSQNTIVKSSMIRIRSKKRKLSTVNVSKQTMSSGDDKRYQLCNIHSVPYGYMFKKLKKCMKCEK